MKLIQAFNNAFSGGGIFTKLKDKLTSFVWLTTHYQDLDVEYFGNWSGQKETSPLIDTFLKNQNVLTDLQVGELADIIARKYAFKWEKYYNILSLEYNPIENYSMSQVETPDIRKEINSKQKTDMTVANVSETNDGKYGFNSEVSVSTDVNNNNISTHTTGDDVNNKQNSIETETGTRQLTRKGNIGVTTSQQMIQSEIELWQWNFFETVFKDVDSILSTQIYN